MAKPSRETRIMAASVCLVLAVAILNANTPFLNMEGLCIVVGGSIANAYLSYRRDDVRKALLSIQQLVRRQEPHVSRLHKDMMQIIMWAYILQTQDTLGLEKEAKKSQDPLIRYGLDLVITGYAAADVRQMMHTVADHEFERRSAPVAVLRTMAASAPAFGMVGTLIGMVMLLHNVGPNIAHIESGLAVAMLSTLYGILVARLFCLPAADKLLRLEEEIDARNRMIAEGLALLADKQKPFYVQDRLNSFLEPSKQLVMDDYKQPGYRGYPRAA